MILGLGMFCFLFCCSVLLQSCKCEVKVCNFTFNVSASYGPDSLNLISDDGIDTSLNGIHFSFVAFHEHTNPACASVNFGFNSAYAFTRYCTIINPIIEASYTLSLDKDVLFNSDTIAAGTNLINYPAFKDHWQIENTEIGYNGGGEIHGSLALDSTISNQVLFDTGEYDVEFGFATEDAQNLRQHLKVVYKL